jgi:hypothetical protein
MIVWHDSVAGKLVDGRPSPTMTEKRERARLAGGTGQPWGFDGSPYIPLP